MTYSSSSNTSITGNHGEYTTSGVEELVILVRARVCLCVGEWEGLVLHKDVDGTYSDIKYYYYNMKYHYIRWYKYPQNR